MVSGQPLHRGTVRASRGAEIFAQALRINVFLDELQTEVGRSLMRVLFIISTDDAETMYNALLMANVGLQKGDEVGVFMLGKAVTYESLGGKDFDVVGQVNQFTEKGDFYV